MLINSGPPRISQEVQMNSTDTQVVKLGARDLFNLAILASTLNTEVSYLMN